jgi:hypothetical protein
MIARAPKTHPRLFLHDSDLAMLKDKIASDSLLEQTSAFVQQVADTIVQKTPVERRQVGRRLLGVSRECLLRVNHLALTYRMTGAVRFLDAAKREMLAAADFSDWNPSHFLDVAEMTAALAIGYDWLFNSLSENDRHIIKRAIVEKGLRASLQGSQRWVTATHNWNQVCHGGLVLGALAILEDEPELATRIIERALEHIPLAMREYAPDGAYPEGPTYWGYGTTYNVLMLAALESVFGTEFGLSASEGFLKSAEYLLHATGPTGMVFNYSDCGLSLGVAPALYWFSARMKNPGLILYAKDALEKLTSGGKGSMDRFLPFLLIWADEMEIAANPEALHWLGQGRTPVAFHRNGWSADATFVATKGGSPSSNHAHMDIGTFVMDALGVRWAMDLGPQNYNQLETSGVDLWNMAQESERWTVFRLNNRSHNTLVVDDKLQRVDGHGEIIAFSTDASLPHTIVDLSPVYDGQLLSAKRGVALRPDGSVLVQDEVETLAQLTKIRWGMVTRTSVEIVGPATATLKQDGRVLTLNVLHPDDIELTTYNTENPPEEYDEKNEGSRMLGFETSLDANVTKRFAVYLRPGGPANELPKILPLAEWPQ